MFSAFNLSTTIVTNKIFNVETVFSQGVASNKLLFFEMYIYYTCI